MLMPYVRHPGYLGVGDVMKYLDNMWNTSIHFTKQYQQMHHILKLYFFTYNPSKLLPASIFLISPSGRFYIK